MAVHEPDQTLRRHFFFVAGFDPMSVEGHHKVFTREIARFAKVWTVETGCDHAIAPTATGATWNAHATGPGWSTQTRFELLAWDEFVRADMARSRWSHILGTTRALADMIASGTVVRYFRLSHRYGIFFVLTYVVLLAITAAALAAGYGAAHLAATPLGPIPALLLAAIATAGVFFGLMATLGKRLRLKQSLDLAEFSVDYARGRHPDIDARVAAFAARVREVARKGGVDEIVIAGHSLGAMHVVSLMAQVLARDPKFGTRIPIRLLTLGSTTAKFALHPAGTRLRAAAHKVHAAPAVGWAEFQARDDIVSFYKVNPVTLGHAGNADGRRRPFVRQITIRGLLTPKTYARFRFDVMRLHCQFFLANDRKAPYDFYAFICAPVTFDEMVRQMDGPMAIFAPDGALIPLADRQSTAVGGAAPAEPAAASAGPAQPPARAKAHPRSGSRARQHPKNRSRKRP
ncbi:alpha/beta hydrolase family protein [Roseixanthobacter glucoisosaccharinicivorans]|uniref:hypothetical protein n=1 Tax=Roseixanthobacter glucoisosaccharinicivorans TaxID=3119923 RepID=UPI00372B1199